MARLVARVVADIEPGVGIVYDNVRASSCAIDMDTLGIAWERDWKENVAEVSHCTNGDFSLILRPCLRGVAYVGPHIIYNIEPRTELIIV